MIRLYKNTSLIYCEASQLLHHRTHQLSHSKHSTTHCLRYTGLSYHITSNTCKCETTYIAYNWQYVFRYVCLCVLEELSTSIASQAAWKFPFRCVSEVVLSTQLYDILQWPPTGVTHFGVEAIDLILKPINCAFYWYVHRHKHFPWRNSDWA